MGGPLVIKLNFTRRCAMTVKEERQCMNGNSIVREPPKFEIVEAKINGDVRRELLSFLVDT